jgi:hypothetical protein
MPQSMLLVEMLQHTHMAEQAMAVMALLAL